MSDLIRENVKTIPIADLVPTQVTVGMREVDVRRRRWREKHSHDVVNYLNKHRLPVILGPNTRHYLIDRHHLTLALSDEGISLATSAVKGGSSTVNSRWRRAK